MLNHRSKIRLSYLSTLALVIGDGIISDPVSVIKANFDARSPHPLDQGLSNRFGLGTIIF